jgi:hypothetical protein
MGVSATRIALLGFFVYARVTLLQASKSPDTDIDFVLFIIVLSGRSDFAVSNQRPLQRLQLKVNFKASGIFMNIRQFEMGIEMPRY